MIQIDIISQKYESPRPKRHGTFKKITLNSELLILLRNRREFTEFTKFLLEFVDTACRIHQHVLAGKERVRGIGDLQLYQRVVIAIFPFSGFFRGGSRAAQESVAIAHVFKNY